MPTESECHVLVSGFEAARLMDSIRLGYETIVGYSCSDSECRLELQRSSAPRPLAARHLETLDGLLRGEAQKFIGLERGGAPSTVALRAKRALEAIGLDCAPKSLPAALLMLAHAARTHVPLHGSITVVPGDASRRVACLERPQAKACIALTPAQAALVDMMVEGTTRTEMTQRRGTSARTIANQLADVYRKLSVSGRTPTLLALMSGSTASLQRT